MLKVNSAAKLIVLLAACISSSSFAGHHMNWQAGLQDKARPEADKKRDAGQKPVEVLQVLGVKSGMRVLDLLASGGYYTEVLSHRVGAKGEVLAHNNKFLLAVMDGRFDKEMTARLANDRLANVTRFQKELGPLGLENEIDVVTLVLNYHDLYSNSDEKMRKDLLAAIRKALKSGGVLGIIDSQGPKGEHNPKLHRIQRDIVKTELAAAGFELLAISDILANPEDDLSVMVFGPSIRGKTDRFLFKFKKSEHLMKMGMN